MPIAMLHPTARPGFFASQERYNAGVRLPPNDSDGDSDRCDNLECPVVPSFVPCEDPPTSPPPLDLYV